MTAVVSDEHIISSYFSVEGDDQQTKKIRLSPASDTATSRALSLSAGGAPAVTGKHAVGHKNEWEKDFPWLQQVRDVEAGPITEYVEPSVQEKQDQKQEQSKCHVERNFVCCLRKDSVRRRHSLSQQHKTAIELELCRE